VHMRASQPPLVRTGELRRRGLRRPPQQVVLRLLDVRAHQKRRRMRIATLDRADQVLMLLDHAREALVAVAVALEQRRQEQPVAVDDRQRTRVAGGIVDRRVEVAVGVRDLRDVAGVDVRFQSLGRATFHVREMAVSDRSEPADLFTPPDWTGNHGTATLQSSASDTRVRVKCCTLDEVFANAAAPQVMKVDVEGCEAQVFRGATGLLSAHCIRDIVFEEMRSAPTKSINLLQSHGYTVFRVFRRFAGPYLAPVNTAATGEIDPPTYLGTTAPERAVKRFAARGWSALRQKAPR